MVINKTSIFLAKRENKETNTSIQYSIKPSHPSAVQVQRVTAYGLHTSFSFELLELRCVSKMSARIDKSIAEEHLLILERKNEGSVVRREQKIEPHISHVLNGSRSTSV